MRGKLGRPSQASQLVIAVWLIAFVVVAITNPQSATGAGAALSLEPSASRGSVGSVTSTASATVEPTVLPTSSASSAEITQPPAVAGSTQPAIGRTAATASPTEIPTLPPTPTATPVPTAAPGGEATLAQLLAMLTTAPEDRTGYDRDLFVHWIDANGDDCDTRQEVLIDESLTPVTVGGGCSLSGGSWVSLYDGVSFTDPSGMDIDHMVPLAEAWDSGASAWSDDRRKRFANDLGVDWALLAVSASSNRSKGDRDPAEWMPTSGSATCTYLADWLADKVRWQLTVDGVERSALATDIQACPDVRMPVVLAP